MQRTHRGRVTAEHLAELEEAANRYPQPWTMGISSHVLAALTAEVRECRKEHTLRGRPGEANGGPETPTPVLGAGDPV